MSIPHKHRKGFRQDAQMLSEAYSNLHEVKLMAIDDEEGELSDDWMKQDYESRQEERGGDHAKGVKMAIEALGMFKDELHIDGHSEDINVNELADAHDQLSRALHWILDETDVEYITGGRATQKAEADSQPEQFTPMEFPHDES